MLMHVHEWTHNLLIKISKRFHIDALFYSKIIGWVGVNYTSGIIRGVVTTFLLARSLPLETFGAFRYVIAVHGIAGIFSFASYHAGIIRGVASGDTEVAWVGAKKMIKFSLIGSLIIFIAALERAWKHESAVALSLGVSAVFFPFLSAGSLYGSILTGKGEIQKLARQNALMNIVFSVLFLATLLLTRNNIPVLALVFFGGDVCLKSMLSWYNLRQLPRRGSAESHTQLGGHLSLMGIFQAFAHQIDQLILQRWFGYAALANYNIAILIPEQILDFMKGFSGIILQRKTQQMTRHASNIGIVRKQMWALLLVMLGVWAVYSLSAPLVIPLLLPHYKSQILPSIIYGLGILASVGGIGMGWMQANHRLKDMWRFGLVNGTVQITGTLVLTWAFGGLGAVLAKTLTRLVSIPLAFPRLSKKEERSPGSET